MTFKKLVAGIYYWDLNTLFEPLSHWCSKKEE